MQRDIKQRKLPTNFQMTTKGNYKKEKRSIIALTPSSCICLMALFHHITKNRTTANHSHHIYFFAQLSTFHQQQPATTPPP